MIVERWTEEQLQLFLEKRNKRVARINKQLSGEPEEKNYSMSLQELEAAGAMREKAWREKVAKQKGKTR